MKNKCKYVSLFICVFLLCSTIPVVHTYAGEPEITAKLNGSLVADISNAIQVNNGDKLEIRTHFSGADEGETFIISLPDIFAKLNQTTLETEMDELLEHVDFEIAYDQPAVKAQQITITFKDSVLNADFLFVATLDFSGNFSEKIIIFNTGEMIKLKHEGAGGSGDAEISIGSRPLATSFLPADFLRKTNKNDVISDSEMAENTTVGNAFYYNLRLNDGLFSNNWITGDINTDYCGTLRDELSPGMQLFIPNAPNIAAAYKNDYQFACLSFDFLVYTTLIKKDIDGYYMDLPVSYLAQVNNVEGHQGRSNTYTESDLIFRLNISQSIVDRISNGEGVLVTYSAFYVGYRLETDGKIHFYTINNYTGTGNGKGEPYEEIRISPWSDSTNTNCVPLYVTSGGTVGGVQSINAYSTQVVQRSGSTSLLSGFTREYLGDTTMPDESVINQWRYKYNGVEEFTLTVIKGQDGQDAFEVKLNVADESSFYHGKLFALRSYIYFDRSKWNIPIDGEITFNNTATYSTLVKSVSTMYSYNFRPAGTLITVIDKTVDSEKKSYMNPEENNALTYAIDFRKVGAGAIPAGKLSALDVLDGHLEFVEGSIEIFRKAGSDWIKVSENLSGASARTVGSPDDLNLEVSCLKVGTVPGILVINTGDMSVGEITELRVVFQTKLKAGTKYGTKITNNFLGKSAETYADHKINFCVMDQDGEIINTPAEFELKYTTDPDYENGVLEDVLDSSGCPIDSLVIGTNGIVNTLCRIDADMFHLKLTEDVACEHYLGIEEPIWIKASRDSVSNEMQYTLEKAQEDVEMDVVQGGLLTFAVSIAYQRDPGNPGENGPTPPDQGGPTPPDQDGPTPPDQDGPTPPDQDGPTPPDQDGPTPPDQDGPTPPDQYEPTPPDQYEPTPADPDELTLADPDEPTSEDPDELTLEDPDEPTSADQNIPTPVTTNAQAPFLYEVKEEETTPLEQVEGGDSGMSMPQTGVNNNQAFCLVLLGSSLVAIGVISIRRKKA